MAIYSFNIFVSTWNCHSHSTKQEWVFLRVEFQMARPSGINYYFVNLFLSQSDDNDLDILKN